jgi:deazaflavin-dependent oxidoreductase (nitroreductase family)
MANIPDDMRSFNAKLVEEYRANGGKLSGRMANSRLLLLTTIGSRSGQKRITPMGYGEDDGRLIVIASNNAAARHPDWYFNLLANPNVTVELGSEHFAARATAYTGETRAAILPLVRERVPFFESQQAQTTREIPIVILERSAQTA